MSDTKDTTLVKRIKTARVLLVIYGIFGFLFAIYIFANYIYGFFHTEGLAIILLPMALAFTLSCIFGGLKEFAAAAQLQESVLLATRTGILGQVLIGMPSFFYIFFSIDDIEYKIGYMGSLLIPLIWILYNIILLSKLLLLKKSQ